MKLRTPSPARYHKSPLTTATPAFDLGPDDNKLCGSIGDLRNCQVSRSNGTFMLAVPVSPNTCSGPWPTTVSCTATVFIAVMNPAVDGITNSPPPFKNWFSVRQACPPPCPSPNT